MSNFSKVLRNLRQNANLTQKQLAELLKTNNSSVCDWECGRAEPNISNIIALCQIFDVSADVLLGLTPF